MRFRRRKFLHGSCVVGVTGLAGCSEVLNGDADPAQDNGNGDDPQDGEVGDPSDDSDEQVPDEEPPTSPAAVVSSHHLATEAGITALDRGGTAADAAIAVAAALSVVEPWFSSAVGGGTWGLYYDAETEEVTSLDGVGPIGSEATVNDYQRRGVNAGMHQAIVPGAWDGWMLWLDRYGKLELGEILEPAIRLGRDGYPVSEEMRNWLGSLAPLIDQRPEASRIYKPEGELLGEEETVYQRDLADTFESLVTAYDDRRDLGRDAAIQAARDEFYRGPIADAIVEFSDEKGGYLTLSDFHEFEAEIVDPISIQYDEGVRVYQNPPNSQGITMLLILNVLKGYDLSAYDPDDADAVHLQAEATKLAFADRYHLVGDPDRVDVPVEELLDDEYAASQRDRIDMDTAMRWPIDSELANSLATETDADHTTTFHVVDREGNAAAVTTSLGAEFLVVPDTGIHINNRMRMVNIDEANPNRLTAGYKVRHTSNPYMSFRDDRLHILGGNTGVDTQPQGQAQQFLSVVEFGLGPQEAVDRPRFVSTAHPSGTFPYRVRNTLQMESGFPPDTVQELADRDHTIQMDQGIFGVANMLIVGGDDDIQAGAEPRTSTAKVAFLSDGPEDGGTKG